MRFTDKDLRARFPESFGYLASVRKRAIRIEPNAADDASIAIGASRLGGAPDLPATVTWPSSGDRALPFVAQIELEKIAEWDEDALLPHEGWLVVFADADRAAARVLHVAASSTLKRVRPPGEAKAYRPCAVGLVPIDLFPAGEPWIEIDAIHKRERDDYRRLLSETQRDVPKGKDHHLLGYPRADDLANIDGDTRLLLQLDSDEIPGFSWGGALMLLAQDADLRQGEVDRVRVVVAG